MASLRPLLDFLRNHRARTEDLLESAGLPAGLIEEPDAFLPLNAVHQFVENSARTLDVPDLGAIVATETSAFDLAFLGPALRRAVNVYDYLQIGAQMVAQLASGERFWMTLEKDQVRFHHQCPGRACAGRTHADVFCMIVTLRTLREVLGPDWCPTEVDLLATDARMLGRPEIFGDGVLRLGQSHSSFTMPFTALQRRMPGRPDPDRAAGPIPTHIEPALPQTFIEDIEAIVEALITAGALELGRVCESAGTSSRTLQRRLGECGSTYSDVVQRSRVRLASEWLLHTSMPVREISMALGYTDPANFTRAFRHTTGISPQHFRNSH